MKVKTKVKKEDTTSTQKKSKQPQVWRRPKLVIPYGPAHFTVEEIKKAVEEAGR